MKQSWKRTSTKVLLRHPRLTVVEDEVLLPDGYTTQYLRFEESQHFVSVLAIRDGKVALMNEYSYPADAWLWQLPDGDAERDESILTAAARELQEETGLVADEIVELGSFLSNHRRSTKRGHVMLATGIHEGEKSGGDREELGSTLHWTPVEEVAEMIRVGEIIQPNILAAFAMYFVHSATKAQA